MKKNICTKILSVTSLISYIDASKLNYTEESCSPANNEQAYNELYKLFLNEQERNAILESPYLYG